MIGGGNEKLPGLQVTFFTQQELCKEFLWEETKSGWKLSRKWDKTR